MDGFEVFIVGIFGFILGILFVGWLLSSNPTMSGDWVCSDWQIVENKPECHVMTLRGRG
jgi:hypothetical protein